jgi:hypothetical protein
MSYTFSIGDSSVLTGHLVLQDADVARTIVDTPEWMDTRKLTAEVKINGVEIPGKVFEELLSHWYTSMEKQIEEQTGFLELANAVDTRARELLHEEADDLMNRMHDLKVAIDCFEDEVMK